MFKRPFPMEYQIFQRFFRKSLSNYWNPITGFDIVKFDNDLNVPDGKSLKDFVIEKYGKDAARLIQQLIH